MTPSRREFLQASLATAGWATALGLGLPSVVEAAGQAPYLWTNKHLNLSANVARHYDVWNRGTGNAGAETWRYGYARLRQIVQEAEADRLRVRAVGARWSLAPVAVCPDIMINTMPLNYHTVGLAADDVSTTSVDPARLVLAQCGTSVMELSQSLEARGLSLPTSGASNGQSICGAISTGTHGSARRVGAMQDYMLGLHLIAENGRSYWIERASNPIVSDAFCQRMDATLIRDDRLFRAAVVGIGSFGVLHAVLFEAAPGYLLEVHRFRKDWPEVAHAAATLDLDGLGLPYPGTEPFHFGVVVNPYRTGRGQRGAVVTAMYRRPLREMPPSIRPRAALVPGVDLLGVCGALASSLPLSIPACADLFFNATVGPMEEPVFGTHGQVFGATGLIGKSLSSEVGVDLKDAAAAIDLVLSTARTYPFPGLVGLRYIQASDAHLAFNRFPTTCTIETSGAGSPRTREFYDRVWANLDAHQIAYTQHWGKIHNINRDNLAARWPGTAEAWLAARQAFLGPVGRDMFSNDLIGRCGLGA